MWRASAVVSAALMPRWNVPFPSLDQKPSWWAVQVPPTAAFVISSGERVTTTTCPPGRTNAAASCSARIRAPGSGSTLRTNIWVTRS